MSNSAGSAPQLWLRTGVSSGATAARLRADGALIPSSLWIHRWSFPACVKWGRRFQTRLFVRAWMRNASEAAMEQQVARSGWQVGFVLTLQEQGCDFIGFNLWVKWRENKRGNLHVSRLLLIFEQTPERSVLLSGSSRWERNPND